MRINCVWIIKTRAKVRVRVKAWARAKARAIVRARAGIRFIVFASVYERLGNSTSVVVRPVISFARAIEFGGCIESFGLGLEQFAVHEAVIDWITL